MRRRSKSVFIGAEVQHYLKTKNIGSGYEDEDDDETKVTTKEEEFSYDDDDESLHSAEANESDEEDDGESNLSLIQQVYQQIPAHDKLSFEERINRIDWKEVSVPNAKRKLLGILESERKFRFLHEILDDAMKSSLKKLNIKRPNTYIGLFISENKEALREKMAKTGSKNMITTANEEFKKLSDAQKQEYVLKATSSKSSYNDEMKKYTLTFRKGGGGNAKVKVKKERKLTPFVLFQEHENLKDETKPRSELVKMYSELPPNKKIIWILRYLGVKHGNKLSYDQWVNAKETLSGTDLSLIDEYEGKPKKESPYNMFVKEFFKKSSSKDIKECAALWKNLSPAEKAKYQVNTGGYDQQLYEYLKGLPNDRREFEINSNPRLSKKTFEKMEKKYSGNNDTTLKHTSSPSKSNKSISHKKENSIKEVPQKKVKKPTIKLPVKNAIAKSFSKFDEDDDQKSHVFDSASPVFDTQSPNKDSSPKKNAGKNKSFSKFNDDSNPKESPKKTSGKEKSFLKFNDNVEEAAMESPKKSAGKKKSFLKFNDDANESVKVHDSEDMPKPIPIKKESDKKRKNADTVFPKPIKIENNSEEESKPKKSKFTDDSFDEDIAHNSTKVEPSPKKKKRVKQDSSSESESSLLKPPKSEYKYFVQHIFKGPKDEAKEAFDNLNAKERKKVNVAFKKAKNSFLADFEKRIKQMSSSELDKYAQGINNGQSNNDEDSD